MENWLFSDQDSSGVPAPSIVGVFQPPGSSALQYVWAVPERESVDEVLRSKAAELDTVRCAYHTPAAAGRLYLLFHSSRQVHTLDMGTGEIALSIASTAQPGTIVQPALTNDYDIYWSADYVDAGYVFVMTTDTRPPGQPAPPTLILIDSNRDGTLDSTRALTPAEWESEGWGSTTRILSHF